MKKMILFFAFILFSVGVMAQSLNDKLGAKIEKTTTYRDGKYRDSFDFIVYPTEKIHIRMFSFEIKEADTNKSLYLIEKYTFGLQYGWNCAIGYTCKDDVESIYMSDKKQWIITLKYINTDDNKEYEKNFITPLKSTLFQVELEDYKDETNEIKPIRYSVKSKDAIFDIEGRRVKDGQKGIIIKNGKKYIQ